MCRLFALWLCCSLPAVAWDGFYFTPSIEQVESAQWEVACDNTGTCRAVGYGGEPEQDFSDPIALLLEYPAGENAPLYAQVMLQRYSSDTPQPYFVAGEWWINGQSYGTLLLSADGHSDRFAGALTPEQTAATVASLATAQRYAL